MLKKRLRDATGGALVEVALTAPIFILLVGGAAELARVAYYAVEVQNAAHAGALYGSLNVANAFGSASNIETAAQDDATNITITFPSAPTQECVCETLGSPPTYSSANGSSSDAPGSCTDKSITGCTANNQDVVEYVVVQTQGTVPAMFPMKFKAWGIGLPTSYTLNGLSMMRVLQN
jgi:Flp pilus assembly protein TadG